LQQFAVKSRGFHQNAQKRSLSTSQCKIYQLVKYSLINSQNWIHVMSDVALHVNMTPLTVEDRPLIKTSQTEKERIVEFPARQ